MLTVEVELLTGQYAATSYHDRRLAEWPPHPARLFSALVAALHATQPADESGREALLWLESQPPPALRCDLSVGDRVGRRSVLDVYVPVNDVTIVGDLEQPLRDAETELAQIQQNPSAKKTTVTRAKKLVEKQQRKLADQLADQQKAGEAVTAGAVRTASALLPPQRIRQVRTFPVAIPSEATITFVWPSDVPENLIPALDRLCNSVTRLGHSSSLVRCAIVDHEVTPTLVPDHDAESGPVLRVVGPGQLDRLESEFEHHRGVESRTLPSRPQRYRVATIHRVAREIPRTVFADEWIVFERDSGSAGPRYLSSRGVDLARALRDALIEQHGSSGLPESLSGHAAGGKASESPHIAFVPLPFAGPEHADGSIQGIAIVLPRRLSAAERTMLLRLIAHLESRSIPGEDAAIELAALDLRPSRFRRVEYPTKRSTMPATWCRPARRFATVTPIALDRNPGNLRSNLERAAHKATAEAQRSVAEACVRIGLPSPERVVISLAPLLPGVQPVRDFRPFPDRRGRTPRVRVHAELTFSEPVGGPLLLGAGRYLGLGLCLPLFDGAADDAFD